MNKQDEEECKKAFADAAYDGQGWIMMSPDGIKHVRPNVPLFTVPEMVLRMNGESTGQERIVIPAAQAEHYVREFGQAYVDANCTILHRPGTERIEMSVQNDPTRWDSGPNRKERRAQDAKHRQRK